MAVAGNLGAIGMNGAFNGFLPADFDAYLQKKWSSNVFTLERRTAKDRVLSLIRAVQKVIETEPEDAELALGSLELGATEESPTVANGKKVQAQWVFFTRNAAERTSLKPLLQKTDLASAATLFDIAIHHQHASVLYRLDAKGFAAGIELATKARVDREHLGKKLDEKWARDKVLELLRSLPEGTSAGLGDRLVTAAELSGEAIEAWIPQLAQADAPFVIEVRWPREDAALSSEAFLETLVPVSRVLLKLYRLIAWSHQTDPRQLKAAVQKEQAKKAKEKETFKAGDRVTILAGLFQGRGGYLQEIIKEKAKVMVGPVAVTVDVKDLKAS